MAITLLTSGLSTALLPGNSAGEHSQFLAGAIAGASSNIQAIFSTFSSIADQSLFLTDLVDFFNVQPTISSKPNALPAPRPIRSGFVFDRVSFSYPGQTRRVLDNLDLRIEPGERIALIGENGQGKTTLVKLITRLYDPTAGRILLDGIDLREYSVEDLNAEIGVIFQDFMRYEMTARRNIQVGRIEDDSQTRHSDRSAEEPRRIPSSSDCRTDTTSCSADGSKAV